MDSCIFCKIIEGKIPSARIYEDENFIVIRDINPLYKVHDLIITRKHIASVNEVNETDSEIFGAVFSVAGKIAEIENVSAEGFRLVVNSGKNAGQLVPHFHMHLLAGEKLREL